MTTVLYRVEGPGKDEEYSPLVSEARMLELVEQRAPKETEGTLRIKRFEYRLDPRDAPMATGPLQRIWKATIERYPDIGSLGTFVCKPLQHGRPGNGKGNAWDYAVPMNVTGTTAIHDWIAEAALWIRQQGMRFDETRGDEGLPVAEIIWLDKIATWARDWTIRSYGGTFHATHGHISAYPLLAPGSCD
jgi:hypothetical protein